MRKNKARNFQAGDAFLPRRRPVQTAPPYPPHLCRKVSASPLPGALRLLFRAVSASPLSGGVRASFVGRRPRILYRGALRLLFREMSAYPLPECFRLLYFTINFLQSQLTFLLANPISRRFRTRFCGECRHRSTLEYCPGNLPIPCAVIEDFY